MNKLDTMIRSVVPEGDKLESVTNAMAALAIRRKPEIEAIFRRKGIMGPLMAAHGLNPRTKKEYTEPELLRFINEMLWIQNNNRGCL